MTKHRLSQSRNRLKTRPPLVEKVERIKHAKMTFFCPLCSTQRELRYSPRLTQKHYGQIAMLTLVITSVAYPLCGPRGILSLPLIWMGYEFINKMLYRQELPCPHCGLDMTWYRKDVKLARRVAERFWEKRKSETQISL